MRFRPFALKQLHPNAFNVSGPSTNTPHTEYADKSIEMYNISEGHSATKGNELGIFESIGDVYAQEDLNLFFLNLYSYVASESYFVELIGVLS